jgi:hypothetical protein
MAKKDSVSAVGDSVKPENEVVEGADVIVVERLPEPTGNITADIRTLFNAVFGNNG